MRPLMKHRSPVTPSPVIRFALLDVRNGDLYPLRGCPRWSDAWFVLEACRAGEDAGLPVPPPPGACLRVTELVRPAEAARRAGARAARQARIDAEIANLEIAALFGPQDAGPEDPEERSAAPGPWERIGRALAAFAEGVTRFLGRGDVAVLALVAGAALLLLRRLG